MNPPAETNSEPSIEEILDSIRQIISDDDEDAGAEVAAAPTPPAPPPPKAAAKPAEEVIELTVRAPEPKKPPPEPIQVDMKDPEPEPAMAPARAPAPEPRRAMTPPPPPEPADSVESILTQKAEAATMEAFSELAQRASIEKGGGITIEDVVRYEVRPLLRAWIDKYLPGIVERLLQKELDKIARRVDQD